MSLSLHSRHLWRKRSIIQPLPLLYQSGHARYSPTKSRMAITSRCIRAISDCTKSTSSSLSSDPGRPPIQIRLPGPKWLWSPFKPLSYPITAYNHATRSHPYLTQFIFSLVIYFLGDLSSQYIQKPASAPPIDTAEASQTPSLYGSGQDSSLAIPSTYNPQRSIRALIIGGIVSIPSYLWFMRLSRLWPTLPYMKSIGLKVGLNTMIYAPLLNAYFFTMHSILSGHGGDTMAGRTYAAWIRVKNTLPQSWMSGCFFWPAVTAFSFSFVPPGNRSLFSGVAAIGWQTYLGLVNQKARQKELSSGIDASVKAGVQLDR